jgi:hypothetical protein
VAKSWSEFILKSTSPDGLTTRAITCVGSEQLCGNSMIQAMVNDVRKGV